MLKYILALILTMTSAPALAQGVSRTVGGGGSATMSPGQKIQADPKTPLQPQVSLDDVKRLPIVRMLLNGGGELYYLGDRSGLIGFLLYKAEQVQTLYLTADMQTVLVGGLYSPDGANITAQQIAEASSQNSQISSIFMAAAEKQKEFEATSGLSKGDDAEPAADKGGLPKAAPLSPGERLHHDFMVASGVIVGESDKPLLLMLVDPLCEHCRKTWKVLKASVMSGALRVKLIPVGAENSERERMAAKFLNVPDPLKVWNKIQEDDFTAVAGEPTPAELAHVRATMAMAQGWKINATPYLVYRGKDKKVKVVQGEPEKIDAVLADLIP